MVCKYLLFYSKPISISHTYVVRALIIFSCNRTSVYVQTSYEVFEVVPINNPYVYLVVRCVDRITYELVPCIRSRQHTSCLFEIFFAGISMISSHNRTNIIDHTKTPEYEADKSQHVIPGSICYPTIHLRQGN